MCQGGIENFLQRAVTKVKNPASATTEVNAPYYRVWSFARGDRGG
jgi:hypothetical protein